MKVKINQQNLKKINEYREFRESLGKSKNTVKTDINAIKKLGKHLGKINFEKVNEKHTQSLFTEIKDFILRDHYASKINCFYKWLCKLDDKERHPAMKWYKYSKRSERERQKDPYLKAKFIDPEEYTKIIQHVKMDLRMSALYETMYISGARPDEVCKMKLEHVINDNGKISIIVTDSKSIPREIPLTEKPNLLLRWYENHPYKDDKKAWLFISLDRRFKNRHIQAGSVSDKFHKLIKELKLKDTLILYSFRKTRATIMFGQGYDDKEMGSLFGWKPHTVIERRNEYDLRGMEDLKAKIFQKTKSYKPREQLEEDVLKIDDVSNEVKRLKLELEFTRKLQRKTLKMFTELKLNELKNKKDKKSQKMKVKLEGHLKLIEEPESFEDFEKKIESKLDIDTKKGEVRLKSSDHKQKEKENMDRKPGHKRLKEKQ